MNAAGSVRPRGHVASGAFVFLLLGIFAVLSTLMVLLSAQFYRVTVDQTQKHNEGRVPGSYLMNVVRGNDRADAVVVTHMADMDVLSLGMESDGERYETRIYCYEGYIYEMFCDADRSFRPDFGEKICQAQQLAFHLEGGALTMELVDGSGRAQTLHAALHCAGAREEAQP